MARFYRLPFRPSLKYFAYLTLTPTYSFLGPLKLSDDSTKEKKQSKIQYERLAILADAPNLPLPRSSQRTSLGDLLTSKCPSLFEKWEPTWWLKSGHLQTFWSSAGDFTKVDPMEFERTFLELPDGGVIAVDFKHPNADEDAKDTPIVLVLPGLTGGSQASYVRTFFAVTCQSSSPAFRGVVVNSRGCGGVPLRTPQISAGSADDLRSALIYIRSRYPDAPLYGVGFSLGATVLTKYLGEEGEKSLLRAGCVLACPWDLSLNAHALESSLPKRAIYSRALAKSYLALLHRSLPSLQPLIPDSSPFLSNGHLNSLLMLKRPTFTEVNTHMTAIIGGAPPTFPHKSVWEFYTWASCVNELKGIRVPLLVVNADDDPIVEILPYDEMQDVALGSSVNSSTTPSNTNPNMNTNEKGWVSMVVTKGGGHLGWFDKDGKRRWVSKPVMEFLCAMEAGVDWRSNLIPGSARREESGVGVEVEKDEFGFVRVVGKSGIGYRVMSEGVRSSDMDAGTIPGAMAGL